MHIECLMKCFTGSSRRNEAEGGAGHQVRDSIQRRGEGYLRRPCVRARRMRGELEAARRRLH